ncbi:phage tail spike protein, partial [Clostridium tarantellae]
FDKFYKDIVEECYIRTKENEYIVKEIHELDNFTEFTCFLNVEDLEGKPWDRYESIEKNIVDALNLAIVSTGWRVGCCNVTKKRTVRKSNCSSWDIIQDIKKTYMVDLQFDCINKKINVYEHLGRDKGVYFMDSLNVIKLESQRDSHNFYTRLLPLGKDGLTIKAINNGKDYVENYQYSKKIKTFYWKDDRYTVVENLKKDGQAKLNELSKPRRAYKVDINNLA